MSSTAGAVTLLIVLMIVLAGAFIGLWIRDKGRADEEAHDIQRIAHDPTRGDLSGRDS
jgi:hypothetical protein